MEKGFLNTHNRTEFPPILKVRYVQTNTNESSSHMLKFGGNGTTNGN